MLLDEFARHEYARESWKATFPDRRQRRPDPRHLDGQRRLQPADRRGQLLSPPVRQRRGVRDRDDRSCAGTCTPTATRTGTRRNARALPAHDRAEQFPRSPEDAFINTGECWFDVEALAWYDEHAPLEPAYRMRFFPDPKGRKASIHRASRAGSGVRAPDKERSYAIGADVATGRGLDYSCAFVIDLTQMKLVAEFHAKIDADEFAEQLHFLGRWYGDARIAVEMGGGYGEPVIISLRDGRKGRPHYPKLYRHTIADRPDMHQLTQLRLPDQQRRPGRSSSTSWSRPSASAAPGHALGVGHGVRTFVRQQRCPRRGRWTATTTTGSWPAGSALEMYRQYGAHRAPPPRRCARHQAHAYPWQRRRRRAA